MTKEEQNQIIKDAWVRNLQKQGDIPEDIGEIYRNWVQAKVKEASSQLIQQQGPGPQEQQSAPQSQGQGQPEE